MYLIEILNIQVYLIALDKSEFNNAKTKLVINVFIIIIATPHAQYRILFSILIGCG